ncbi:uncharacterized protein LOC116337975 [Contarinia nasturtii]|uniref:uncharacterized protein LOC116337975 n=1 Tax=Contarinia nasturtii TaxID=265458 RepID=UPI0012D3FFA2|nr:uncharacterized protein LOC116337975 [Contarinia nasturtii]
MYLSWNRPESSEYPKIWHTFTVSGEKYHIQDLPPSITEKALQFMKENSIDEPLAAAYKIYEDEVVFDQMEVQWRSVIEQKAVLVCFKEGSDEIVGINMNYVLSIYDHILMSPIAVIKKRLRNVYSMFERMYYGCIDRKYKLLCSLIKSNKNDKRCLGLLQLMTEDFDIDVDEVLVACGLCVAQKYRGRGIAVELLKTRKIFCEEFNIKLTINVFSSHIADACAEKAGFELLKTFSYDEIRKNYPHLKVPIQIESNSLTFRAMKINSMRELISDKPKSLALIKKLNK